MSTPTSRKAEIIAPIGRCSALSCAVRVTSPRANPPRPATKRITVPVTNLGASIHPFSKKVNAAFQTAFTIQRKDYGMAYGLTDAANIVVGNDVEIELTILAEKQGK